MKPRNTRLLVGLRCWLKKHSLGKRKGTKIRRQRNRKIPQKSLSGTIRLPIVSHSATRYWHELELGFKHRALAALTTIKLVRHDSRTTFQTGLNIIKMLLESPLKWSKLLSNWGTLTRANFIWHIFWQTDCQVSRQRKISQNFPLTKHRGKTLMLGLKRPSSYNFLLASRCT